MQKQSGFSPLIMILVVAVLIVIGLVTWRIWRANQPDSSFTNQTIIEPDANNDSSQILSSPDGKISFLIPNSWNITHNFNGAGECKGFPGSDSGPCYMAALVSPTGYSAESVWRINAYKTTKSPREWAEIPLGSGINASSTDSRFKSINESSVNGYNTFSTKVVDPSYTDICYFIKQGDYIVYATFREKSNSTDLSSYTQEFDSIVKSIRFND